MLAVKENNYIFIYTVYTNLEFPGVFLSRTIKIETLWRKENTLQTLCWGSAMAIRLHAILLLIKKRSISCVVYAISENNNKQTRSILLFVEKIWGRDHPKAKTL